MGIELVVYATQQQNIYIYIEREREREREREKSVHSNQGLYLEELSGAMKL